MAEILEFDKMFYTNFEPKMKNRYVMEIENIPSYLVKAANRPSIQFEPIVLDHINVKRKLKGKGDWQDVTITLYDPIVPSAAQAVMDWIRLGHESITGRDGYADFYKKDVTLNMLGPVGDIVGEWIIKGAFVQSSNFGAYNWSTDEAISVEMTLAMDYCVLNF